MAFFSTTLTVLTSPLPILKNKPLIKRVTQVQLFVRSMGTASYIGIGGSDTQDRRLLSIGSSISISAEQKKYFNPLTIFAVSDTSDSVLEIMGESYD